jgi:Ion channel
VLLAQVFRAGPVNSYRVQGAIAVYLLFGAGWAHAYHLTAILHPGSFNAPSGNMSTPLDWTYFSFVTLSTLGYGDITPVHPIARVLAAGEALAGQLYLAVLIARLVAMEVVSWQSKTNQNSQ